MKEGIRRREGKNEIGRREEKIEGREERTKTYDEGNLKQRTQLILILNTRLRMNQRSLIRNSTITPHQDIIRYRLSKHFHLEDVGDDFFRFAIDVGVHEGDVVVAGYDVSERAESFFDSLERDRRGERVSQVLEFLIRRGGRDE